MSRQKPKAYFHDKQIDKTRPIMPSAGKDYNLPINQGLKVEKSYSFVLPKESSKTSLDERHKDIFLAGKSISGGHGFWGHEILQDKSRRADAIRAWIDGLSELGLTNTDIVFYGDWVDARHIADSMTYYSSYSTMKGAVKDGFKDYKRTVEYVHNVNKQDYPKEYSNMEEKFINKILHGTFKPLNKKEGSNWLRDYGTAGISPNESLKEAYDEEKISSETLKLMKEDLKNKEFTWGAEGYEDNPRTKNVYVGEVLTVYPKTGKVKVRYSKRGSAGKINKIGIFNTKDLFITRQKW